MINIDLSGKLAVVTGATGQLGRVMAKTLAKCGADVAVHYHKNAEMAQRLCAELRAMGVKSEAFSCNICSLDEVMSMRKEINRLLGEPDIIVDNAVIQYDWTSVLNQSIADYQSQFDSCVLQNVIMAKAFLPAMIKKGTGRMIGINTECAMQCKPTQSAYSAGKRGMDGVMRVLAREVGEHQITVNQIAPGWTISDRTRESNSEVQPTDEAIPLKRRGTDQEVANVVAFIASDLASYITGAYIPVCGGNVMPTI